jgi:hypothetical protein
MSFSQTCTRGRNSGLLLVTAGFSHSHVQERRGVREWAKSAITQLWGAGFQHFSRLTTLEQTLLTKLEQPELFIDSGCPIQRLLAREGFSVLSMAL